jgi:putative endopeptidase
MLMKYKLFTCAALAMTLAIGGGLVDRSAGQPATVPQIGAWGFDVNGVDAKAKPGDSFFDYANGAWAARTVIPPDKARFGMFDALRDKTEDQVHTIILAAAKSGASPTTDEGKIGALYNAFMDEPRIEQRDVAPITDDLNKIRDTKTKADITALMGRARGGGFGASLFSIGVSEDQKDPTRHTLQGQEREVSQLRRPHARHGRLAGRAKARR